MALLQSQHVPQRAAGRVSDPKSTSAGAEGWFSLKQPSSVQGSSCSGILLRDRCKRGLVEHHSNVPDVQLTSQQGPLRSTGTIFKCFWIKGVAEHKGPLIPDPLYRQGQSRFLQGGRIATKLPSSAARNWLHVQELLII